MVTGLVVAAWKPRLTAGVLPRGVWETPAARGRHNQAQRRAGRSRRPRPDRHLAREETSILEISENDHMAGFSHTDPNGVAAYCADQFGEMAELDRSLALALDIGGNIILTAVSSQVQTAGVPTQADDGRSDLWDSHRRKTREAFAQHAAADSDGFCTVARDRSLIIGINRIDPRGD